MDEKKLAFEEYFQACYSKAVRFAMKRVSDRQAAEDLVIDAFAACYERFDSFDPQRASFATWLYVVLKNRLKNYYRGHKQHEDIDDWDGADGGIEDEILAAQELHTFRQELARALKDLPEAQEKIVRYKYFEGKSSVEISFLMGLEPGNVRVQLSRALKKLRAHFEAAHMEWGS